METASREHKGMDLAKVVLVPNGSIQVVARANVNPNDSTTWATHFNFTPLDPIADGVFCDAEYDCAFFDCVIVLHGSAFQRSRCDNKTPLWGLDGCVVTSSFGNLSLPFPKGSD
jgi:hypothetical protein